MQLKEILLTAFVTSILVAGIYFHPIEKISISYKEHENPLQPDEWLYYQKAFPYNKIDAVAQSKAIKYTLELKLKNKQNAMFKSAGGSEDDWQFIGPTIIGGRIQDVEMPNGSDQTVYAGSASGGVLRSYNFGDTWEMIFDENESLSIGDIVIDPVDTNIIYVGTGEPNVGGGSLTYDGNGIYKSTDGGNTWNNTGLTEMGNTGRLAIDPQNTNIVFAAMMGNLFENNSNRGLFKTDDGGATWENVLFVSDSTGAIDVVINPDDPQIIYAAMWERVRRFNRRDAAGFSSGIYKSTDGGDTWNELTTGLPSGELSRITLSLCNAEPEIIYACIIDDDESILDIYKTTNGGDSWTDLNASGDVSSVAYDYWFGGVKVDPNNPDNVFYIGFTPSRSTNGGNTWNSFAGAAHVDNHTLFISPTNSDIKILGNDGGLYFTTNNFSTYTTVQNIPVTQIYDFDVYQADTSFIIAGAQDNNSFIKSAGSDTWYYVNGGDGVSSVFLQTNDESYYANSQYGGYYGKVDGINVPLGLPFDRYIWRSPIAVNPLNGYTIYFGGTKVYRTNDGGYDVNAISSDLTNGPGISPVIYGCVSTIHNAIADTNYIYAGCDDGNVWRSKNYGDDWEKISDVLPKRFVTSIQTDPADAEIVYVTFSGYRWADDIAHVYRSTNAGDIWENIEGDLPDIPVNDIAVYKKVDSTYLYIANDAGVYVSYDEGIFWNLLGSTIPIVSVYDIELHAETNTLFAGTYGRGIYKINLPIAPPPPLNVYDDAEMNVAIYPNPVSDNLFIEMDNAVGAMIKIYGVNGKVLFQKEFFGKELTIDMKGFDSGSYFLGIKTAKKEVVRKVVKM
ncbi:MAG: T9SS type A sorting domain-containing protein [Fimbriimonadaceae bacterium]|nr:T9SS type A sorting domain-containing protein [Chitinophagales bacterium]